MIIKIASLCISIILFTSCNPASPHNSNLLLISTTSTQDSGLLDVLLPAFSDETGYHVQLVAVGSGQALQLGEQGNADVILLHSPEAEREFVASGFGIDRRLVMHNDFVIVGPPSDPASLRTQSGLDSAFEAIFSSASTFVSRGDESGTHVKELAIWSNARLDPRGENWYLETGQGQGATLSIASERGGYAITDRGTFLAYKPNVHLDILFEGDPFLLNIYHVITVNPDKHPGVNLAGARAFAGFITSPEGQQIIGEFGVEEYGQPFFFPDAGRSEEELILP